MTTASAVDEIWAILQTLGGPREAARALAGAHVMLIEAEGVRTEADARTRVMQSAQATLDVFKERAGLPNAH